MKNTVLGKAETIDQALKNAKSKVPEGWIVLKKKVLSDGRPKIISKAANTLEEAWQKVEAKIPDSAKVIEKKVVRGPVERLLEVSAFSPNEVENIVSGEISEGELIKHIHMAAPGKTGFLGIGRKKSLFNVTVIMQACVQINYLEETCVKLEITNFENFGSDDMKFLLDSIENQNDEMQLAHRRFLPLLKEAYEEKHAKRIYNIMKKIDESSVRSFFKCAMCKHAIEESSLPCFRNDNGAFVCQLCLEKVKTMAIRSVMQR